MRIIYIFISIFIYMGAFAQVKTPQPSPRSTISQQVGLTTVEVDYSRPSARGRKVIGGLVRYGDIWRTGANKNTTVSFSDPIDIVGKSLAAGKYGLYTRPSADQWEVYFYKKNNMGDASTNWDEDQVVLSLTVPSVYFDPMVETFTINFSDLKSGGAKLNLIWEHTLVALPFEVPTDTKAMESINKTLYADPKSGDYYQAAVYFLQEDMELAKAQGWIEKAIKMRKQPAFWMYRQYALILSKLGDKKAALTAIKKSNELAEKAGNKDYVIMNNSSIADWSN